MAEPDFWTNKERAQKYVEEVSTLRGKVGPLAALETQVEELPVLIELARESGDAASADEVGKEHTAILQGLSDFELKMTMFSSGEARPSQPKVAAPVAMPAAAAPEAPGNMLEGIQTGGGFDILSS